MSALSLASLARACATGSAVFAAGCDIVQGFQTASDAVFPEELTYLDAPGYRTATGGFRDLEFTGGTDLYLLARSADPSDRTLYSMLYGNPQPCTLTGVGRHISADGTIKGPAFIAYLEGDREPGTLRFADASCHHYDVEIPDASLPFTQLKEGFLVYIYGSRELRVENPLGGSRVVVGAIDNVFFNAVADSTFIQTGGRLVAFGPDWIAGDAFGDGIVAGATVGSSFYYEDRNGIHRVTSSGGSAPHVADTLIEPEGCTLGVPFPLGAAESWLAYYAPCADRRLVVRGALSDRVSPLGVDASPGYLALLPQGGRGATGDPAVDPFFIFYLRELDLDRNLGSLWVRAPGGGEAKLGANAALERLVVLPSADETRGYALVDVNGGLGTYVRFALDGSGASSVEELGRGVLRGSGDLLVDFDGHAGRFALPTKGPLSIVASGVPAGRFKFRDPKSRWTAIFHDLQGTNASLSITRSSLDFSEAAHADLVPPVLERVASGVLVDPRTMFMTSLPGVLYLSNYDPTRAVGRLDYRNLELGFTATVSEGVADYVSIPDGVIYSVPFGDGAGIWAVRAR